MAEQAIHDDTVSPIAGVRVLDLTQVVAGPFCTMMLAKRGDELVENFAPGTAARLGMGWEELHALNPRLLYCSISGFGQTGPHREKLAMDPIIQAMTGIMSVTGQPDSG